TPNPARIVPLPSIRVHSLYEHLATLTSSNFNAPFCNRCLWNRLHALLIQHTVLASLFYHPLLSARAGAPYGARTQTPSLPGRRAAPELDWSSLDWSSLDTQSFLCLEGPTVSLYATVDFNNWLIARAFVDLLSMGLQRCSWLYKIPSSLVVVVSVFDTRASKN
ncbi:hypothetical protein TSAR_009198, partial [Trichomalopsis sarcophagae]